MIAVFHNIYTPIRIMLKGIASLVAKEHNIG